MKTGILGATLLITSTTIDDAVWLVPYCTSPHLPLSTKIIHGLTFIGTLEVLSIACTLFYYGMKSGLQKALVDKDENNNNGIQERYDNTNSSLYREEDNENVLTVTTEENQIGFIMECIGALICWSIAIFLYVKKMMKRRRRKLERLQQKKKREEEDDNEATHLFDNMKVPGEKVEQQKSLKLTTTTSSSNRSIPSIGQNAVHSYTFLSMDTTRTLSNTDIGEGISDARNNQSLQSTPKDNSDSNQGSSMDEEQLNHLESKMSDVITARKDEDDKDHASDDDKEDDDDINKISTTPSIPIIISLTTLGALDEISYFPALIMGKIFTPFELCLGALFASVIILIVITLFLAQCKPLVDCLDRIPLYGIVGMFAIILTVGLFL